MDTIRATPYPPTPTRYFAQGVYLLPPRDEEAPTPRNELPWFSRTQLSSFGAYLRRCTPDFWLDQETGTMQDAYVILDA